jgi:hypothetical protein
MTIKHALEYAEEALRKQDGGDPDTETGWRSEELLEAWLAIRRARAFFEDDAQ